MSKRSSQDATAIQSGSLSDTTHCGSVVEKTSKRGVFFRKSAQIASSSHTKDGCLERLNGNVTHAESISFNGLQFDPTKSSLPPSTNTSSIISTGSAATQTPIN
ncbi:1208_t:CDS:1, partial [Cetraspora pellucida]